MKGEMKYCVDTVELRKLMIEKGIESFGEMARISGVNRGTVAKVVKGLARPSTDVMDRFIDALEMESTVAGAVFFKQVLRNT